MDKQTLKILLAEPRGFCAGVERAILIVERTLEKYGAPVYVRHEIVHNQHVLESLRQKGAIFIKTLEEAPTDRPIIFSAHGVPKSVPQKAEARNMIYLDATCPLVSKVHRETERHHKNGAHILLIGHANHPEVIGTMGQTPKGSMTLIETVEEAKNIIPPTGDLAFATQTTLSIDETSEIIACLKERFPNITAPKKEDICYATSNRQDAVKKIAPQSDLMFILGAPNSSNSLRLVEVAQKYGCPQAQLVESVKDINWNQLENIETIGITASASAPEILIQEILTVAKTHFKVTIETVQTTIEDIHFKLPTALRS